MKDVKEMTNVFISLWDELDWLIYAIEALANSSVKQYYGKEQSNAKELNADERFEMIKGFCKDLRDTLSKHNKMLKQEIN